MRFEHFLNSKRNRLAGLLGRARILETVAKLPSSGLTILGYHRVWSDCAGNSQEFDGGVYDVAVEQFYKQMQWLKRHAYVLAEQELIEHCYRGRRLPCRAVMLTFDDAYVDNYSVVYPILKELGLPAIFFVPTGLIQNRKVGWWDEIAFMVRKCDQREFSGSFLARRFGGDSVDTLVQNLQTFVKTAPQLDVDGFLDLLSKECQVDRPALPAQDGELMSWDMIAKMADDGFGIGSHSVSHRVFTTLNRAEQRHELAQSRADLSAFAKIDVRSFAFPVGAHQYCSQAAASMAHDIGYQLVFSFETGRNAGKVDPLFVRRLPAMPTYDLMMLEMAMAPFRRGIDA